MLIRCQHTNVNVQSRFQSAEDLFPVAGIQFNLVESHDILWLLAGHITDRVDDELAKEGGRHDSGRFENDLQVAEGYSARKAVA